MNKCRWWAIVWLGLIASAGALANSEVHVSALGPASTTEHQAAIAGVEAVTFVGSSTHSNPVATGATKLSTGTGYDSSNNPGPSSFTFILAGFGALVVAATRRRAR